jgi:hypothetical protein
VKTGSFNPNHLSTFTRCACHLMKHLLIALLSLSSLKALEPVSIPFEAPKSIPLKVSLIIPPNQAPIVTHNKTDAKETITAKLNDLGDTGLQVEIKDSKGKQLWLHDFGYNLSASQGCQVNIRWHKSLPLILIHYEGYKWDHGHKLLFIKETDGAFRVGEFADAKETILGFLRKQKGYKSEYKYWIYPSDFDGDEVLFECIPQAIKSNAHPFAQDIQWYQIKAAIDSKFRITPNIAKATPQ